MTKAQKRERNRVNANKYYHRQKEWQARRYYQPAASLPSTMKHIGDITEEKMIYDEMIENPER